MLCLLASCQSEPLGPEDALLPEEPVRPAPWTGAAPDAGAPAAQPPAVEPPGPGAPPVVQPPATSKRRIEYVVIAHPDDEVAAWALIENQPEVYPVFIAMTAGEETGYCEPGAERAWEGRGELRPLGDPYHGRTSPACRAARLDSWHGFLDAMATHDAALSSPQVLGRFEGEGAAGGESPGHVDAGSLVVDRGFEVRADLKSARVTFNLGDGDLRPEEVTWALQTVRRRRAEWFPALTEDGVIAASYSNVGIASCTVYAHPDHRAVQVALFSTDQGVPGARWGRTCVDDPDAVRVARMSDASFEATLGVDAPAVDPGLYPDAERRGAVQVHYGWLRNRFWPADLAGRDHFSKVQAFWRRD